MDTVSSTVFIGLVVTAVVAALKDKFPTMTGNTTRIAAIIVGGLVGLVIQLGFLPPLTGNVVTGIMAGVGAIGTVSIADRTGGNN